jgi:hypothetical protein
MKKETPLSFCYIQAQLPQIAAGVSYLTSRKGCVNMTRPVTCSPYLLWVSGVGIACLLNLVTRGAGVPGSRHFTLKANTCHGNTDVLAGGQVLAGSFIRLFKVHREWNIFFFLKAPALHGYLKAWIWKVWLSLRKLYIIHSGLASVIPFVCWFICSSEWKTLRMVFGQILTKKISLKSVSA